MQKEYNEEAKTDEQRRAIEAEINNIEAALRKAKGGFESADEVLQRFTEHMGAGKAATENMAQTLDEKLAGATSSFDEDIKRNTELLDLSASKS